MKQGSTRKETEHNTKQRRNKFLVAEGITITILEGYWIGRTMQNDRWKK